MLNTYLFGSIDQIVKNVKNRVLKPPPIIILFSAVLL